MPTPEILCDATNGPLLKFLSPDGLITKQALVDNNGNLKIGSTILDKVINLAFGNPYNATFSSSYTATGYYRFPGTSITGSPSSVKAILSRSSGATSMSCKIYDITNSLAICEKTGVTNTAPAVHNLGNISNLSTGEAIWGIQIKKTGGDAFETANIFGLSIIF